MVVLELHLTDTFKNTCTWTVLTNN